MTDDTTRPDDAAEQAAGSEMPGDGSEPETAQAREWLSQLQHMIDRLAASTGPIARDVAAKAAELAALAGEKAGPIAKRAAEVTGDVGTRVAERSRRLADDLRHRAAEGDGAAEAAADGDAPAAAEGEPSAS